MLDGATLGLFLAACLVLAATPGPDMLLISSRSLSQGPAAGFVTLLGIQLGTYCHALAVALGLSQLVLAVPLAFEVVKLSGAAYLLFLAYKAIRAPAAAGAGRCEAARYGLPRLFAQGLLTNLLNPKMALFMLALLPQFLSFSDGYVVGQALLLTSLLNGVGLVVNGVVILLAGRLRQRFAASSGRRWPQYLLGSVFATLALRLALSER
ncbi:LysE family translocator [Craterilacuibacter sp. RT1T]|uniref:LysE family translocator n=1 Tax=Craterilacuibacter sp. RT1T TaxID=2942211 RepID=UPI0020BE7AE6|nr:LysE family translocator [Craterilacuibacter sp. RT1T]MCL6264079.1 LysE family translocator [Craterilacuibacter sp. RT1T]